MSAKAFFTIIALVENNTEPINVSAKPINAREYSLA
jgi:hypothetical protein